MDFIGFRWISCRNHGFDTVGVARCVLSGPKHFGSVLGVIATREETSGVLILLWNGGSELTWQKWSTKGNTYCRCVEKSSFLYTSGQKKLSSKLIWNHSKFLLLNIFLSGQNCVKTEREMWASKNLKYNGCIPNRRSKMIFSVINTKTLQNRRELR